MNGKHVALLMAMESPWSREIAARLSEERADVTVFHFDPPITSGYLRKSDQWYLEAIQDFERDVGRIRKLNAAGPRLLRNFVAAHALRRALHDARPDILLVLYGGRFAALAMASGFRPYAVYVVGSDVHASRGIGRLVTRRALSRAHLVLANGHALAQAARLLSPRAKVTDLYIGLDAERFSPPDVEFTGPPGIICTRGFADVYDNATVVRAVGYLELEAPSDFRVTFSAGGPLLDEARKLAQELHLDHRIDFLGGIPELAPILRTHQIYVSMAVHDGMSISLLEAMAVGLLPIVSDTAANREWYDPRIRNMALVPVGDAHGLATAMSDALADPDWRERVRSHNRQLVVEVANIRANMRRLSRMMDSILSDQRSEMR